MTKLAIKLYLIPGTGMDRRMYAAQLEQFPDIAIPEWLPPQNLKESLESYAKRLSSRIDTSKPFMLGGVSLGGMIAQQMALSLKPEAVILIATCSSCKAMPLSRRLLGKLTRAMPDAIIKLSMRLAGKAVMATHSRRKAIYASMLTQMPPRLVRWQAGAASEWTLKGTLTMPIFHIHGDKDPIIPIANVKPQAIVKDGGHLINATHEAQVNQFIADAAAKVSGPQPVEGALSRVRF